jgi:hypothetical protein
VTEKSRSPVTVSGNTAEVEALKLVSPWEAAVVEFEPTGRLVV